MNHQTAEKKTKMTLAQAKYTDAETTTHENSKAAYYPVAQVLQPPANQGAETQQSNDDAKIGIVASFKKGLNEFRSQLPKDTSNAGGQKLTRSLSKYKSQGSAQGTIQMADIAEAAARKASEFSYIPTPRVTDSKTVIKFSAAQTKPLGQARCMHKNQQMSRTGSSAMAQLRAGLMNNQDNKASNGASAKPEALSLASVGRYAASLASVFRSSPNHLDSDGNQNKANSRPGSSSSKAPIECDAKVAEAVAFERKHTMGDMKKASASQAQPMRRIALGDIAHEAVKKSQEFHYQPTPRGVIGPGDISSYGATPVAPQGKPRRMPSMSESKSDKRSAPGSQAMSKTDDMKLVNMAEAKAAQHAAHPDIISLADVGNQAAKKAKHFHYKPTPNAIPDQIKNAYSYSAMPTKPLGQPKRMPSLKESTKSQYRAPQPGLMPAQKRNLSSNAADSKATVVSKAQPAMISLADVAHAASKKAAEFHPSVTPRNVADSKKVIKADAKVVDALNFEKRFAPEAQTLAASAKLPRVANAKTQVITTTTTTTIPAHMTKQPVVSSTKVDVKKPVKSMAAATSLAMKRTGSKLAAGAAEAKDMAMGGVKNMSEVVKASADNLGHMARGASAELAHNAKKAGSMLSHEMQKASNGMKASLAVAAKGAVDLKHKASDAAAVAMDKANHGMHNVAKASEAGAVKTAEGVHAASNYIAHKANKAGDTMASDSRQIFKGAKRALSAAARKTGDIAADMGSGIEGVTENVTNGTTSAWSRTKAFFSDMKRNMEANAKARQVETLRKKAIKAEQKEMKNQQAAAAKARETMHRNLKAKAKTSLAVSAKPERMNLAAAVPSAPIQQKITTTVEAKPVQIMQPVITKVIETKTPISSKAYFDAEAGAKKTDKKANFASTEAPLWFKARYHTRNANANKVANEQAAKMSVVAPVESDEMRLEALAKQLKKSPIVSVQTSTGVVENGKFKTVSEDHKMMTASAAKSLKRQVEANLNGEEIVRRRGGFMSMYSRKH